MTKVKTYNKGKLHFWVYANKIVIEMSKFQHVRYDIYTTANKRNFYSFKKALLQLIESGEEMTFYDVYRLGRENRIVGTAAMKPKEDANA